MHYPGGIQAITLYRDHFILAIHEDSPLANSAGVSPAQWRDCVLRYLSRTLGHSKSGAGGAFSRDWVSGPDGWPQYWLAFRQEEMSR
ncbi:hypothetical protein AWB69_00870 [Caballeronia udeis]|uniref:Uncharacterized protein n=2 Tax=Caballeronia udeis TaxID=1232866 RepID=A0A158FAH5_9BURK|nr:hypothetical protein AWB69_00870 [Caballeronia udeis]